MTQHIEPVAWMNDHGAVTSFEHGRKAWESSGITSAALVRLSDAQAALAAAEERGRIEERERIRLDAVEVIREWMYARTGIRITYRTAQTFADAITKEPTP